MAGYRADGFSKGYNCCLLPLVVTVDGKHTRAAIKIHALRASNAMSCHDKHEKQTLSLISQGGEGDAAA